MRKSLKKIVLVATVSLLAMSTVIQAQTLSQAGKVEMTTSVVENGRGYGNQEQASSATGSSAKYTQYTQSLISNVEAGLLESTSLSDGSCYWQELRVLRFSGATDKSVYEDKLSYFDSYVEKKATQYDEGKLTAVNAMRVASVTGDEKYLDVLAHGYGGTDAFAYDKKAGTYAVDYILMALDLNN